jgi:quercetin dioxygenase-like cupin family protein
MRIRPFRRHPLFAPREAASGGSFVLGRCWNFQLHQGEDTRHRMQSHAEEVYLILSGGGRMTVAEKTCPVHEGEIIFVPPQVDHYLANPGCPLLSGVSIEALPEKEEGGGDAKPAAEGEADRRESPLKLDEVLQSLPGEVAEADAIQAIVRLFDIGGALSEQIEQALGLDNEVGAHALSGLERKLMSAVVQIVDRYRLRDLGGWTRRRWS